MVCVLYKYSSSNLIPIRSKYEKCYYIRGDDSLINVSRNIDISYKGQSIYHDTIYTGVLSSKLNK